MEVLGMNCFSNIYKGKKVLLTGNTGFKGSWLALWLRELGAEVVGVALNPSASPSHWSLLKLPIDYRELDIRDLGKVVSTISEIEPDIVFHLAAQAIVRHSYNDPYTTWTTNVIGTMNVLDACRQVDSLKAIVCVTTDKCYENQEWPWGYRETDRLGGHDPYSASKASAELVASSYRKSFFNEKSAPLLATARAGNVIGGGDWSEDRLIPDYIHSIKNSSSLEIRSPDATRPWQHVLESLSGYLLLGKNLLERNNSAADAWNFGPKTEGNRTVIEVLNRLSEELDQSDWYISSSPQPHEATLLYLDSAKANKWLNWKPVWNFEQTVSETARWYRHWLTDGEVISLSQLKSYISLARSSGLDWAK